MTGLEFKLIRMARKITGKQIANKIGYKSKTPILNAEKLETMPNMFVNALEAITGLKFDNKAIIEQLAIEAAMTFSKLDYRNSIWNSKYSKFIKINAGGNE
jgi:transcriptional regulator with XRE-family HTH domain